MDPGMKFAPFRRPQDFFDTAHFRLPSLKDDARWTNRVVNNLLYYQTNYIALFISGVLLTSLFNPSAFFLGLFGFACLLIGSTLCVSKHPSLIALRTKNLPSFVIATGFLGFLIYLNLRSVAIFSFPFAITILVILIHASTRTRNIKNKVMNAAETLGISKTPMGVLMELAGYEIRLRADASSM